MRYSRRERDALERGSGALAHAAPLGSELHHRMVNLVWQPKGERLTGASQATLLTSAIQSLGDRTTATEHGDDASQLRSGAVIQAAEGRTAMGWVFPNTHPRIPPRRYH
jgi:hypothetical protein